MSGLTKNRLSLCVAAILFSTGGAAIKACSLSSWQVAGFRSGIAAVVLSLALPGARRGWTWRTALIGLAYAATLILFVLANKMTTSANAIFLQSTAPLYLLLLGPLVLRERIHRIDLAVMAGVAAGALLLLAGNTAAGGTAPTPRQGNLLALGAGLMWAFTITGLRWMGKHAADNRAAAATVIAGNLIAFVVCLPLAVPMAAGFADLAVLMYLGVFQVALAYIFLTKSLQRVRGLEASTLLLIEPVFNPVWSWLVHGERPVAATILGGVLIITVTLCGTVVRSNLQEFHNSET